jgi:hypothetical protein
MTIDDRYSIVAKFGKWIDEQINLQPVFAIGARTALRSANAKLIEINREAQRIADANYAAAREV